MVIIPSDLTSRLEIAPQQGSTGFPGGLASLSWCETTYVAKYDHRFNSQQCGETVAEFCISIRLVVLSDRIKGLIDPVEPAGSTLWCGLALFSTKGVAQERTPWNFVCIDYIVNNCEEPFQSLFRITQGAGVIKWPRVVIRAVIIPIACRQIFVFVVLGECATSFQ